MKVKRGNISESAFWTPQGWTLLPCVAHRVSATVMSPVTLIYTLKPVHCESLRVSTWGLCSGPGNVLKGMWDVPECQRVSTPRKGQKQWWAEVGESTPQLPRQCMGQLWAVLSPRTVLQLPPVVVDLIPFISCLPFPVLFPYSLSEVSRDYLQISDWTRTWSQPVCIQRLCL